MPRTSTPSAERRRELADLIRASAREDIRLYGILGLRVTRVARRAHCSVTQIYRCFEDRDGLLAAVLGDMFSQITSHRIRSVLNRLRQLEVITLDHVLDLIPTPSSVGHDDDVVFRSQILAMAAVNDGLRDRLSAIAGETYPSWVEACDIIEARLDRSQSFDRRVVLIGLLNSNLYYNSLLGDRATTDAEYRQYLRDALSMPVTRPAN